MVGIPEIIASDSEGLLVEPGDPEALADALQRVLTSPALCAQFAYGGRRKAEHRFDIKKNVAVLWALLLDGIDPARTPAAAETTAPEITPATEGRP
jgi:glycosyltransferase involved in cell wall biosynthesis